MHEPMSRPTNPELMVVPSADGDETDLPLPPVVPRSWPLRREEWLEYQHAKLRQVTTTQIAVAQLKADGARDRAAITESLQGLHGKVDKLGGRVERIDTNVAALQGTMVGIERTTSGINVGVGDLAEMFGKLAGDLYGHSRDTRDKMDSLADADADHDQRILLANVKAARAKLDADAAGIEAAKAHAEADDARRQAQEAMQAAALAKVQAEKANVEAALAKVQAEKSEEVAQAAKSRTKWQIATLLSTGPVLYTVFKVIYEVLHTFPSPPHP